MNALPQAQPLTAVDEIEWDRLSTRSCNALMTAGITTLSALRTTSRLELMSIRSLGKKSVEEIEVYLEASGAPLSAPVSEMSGGTSDQSIEARLTDVQKGILAKPVGVLAIPVRVRNGLDTAKVHYVGEVVQLEPSVLIVTKNLGRKSIQHLSAALEVFGMTLPMRLETWSEETRVAWEREFGVVAEQFLAKNALCPAIEEDMSNAPVDIQLQALSTAVVGQRHGELVARLLGWSGASPQTLEAAAEPFGVTRQRAQQIVLKFKREVRPRNFRPLWLPLVARVFDERSWLRVMTAPALFRERGVELGGMNPCGLIAALDLFDAGGRQLEAPSSGPLKGFIVRAGSEPIAKKILSKVRKITSRQGCLLVDNLIAWACEEWPDRVDEQSVRELVEEHPWVKSLSRDGEWAWAPDVPRSRIFRPIRQVLTAAGEVSITELRSAIRRDLRMEGFAPPLDVLVALLRGLPWCTVSGDRVSLAASAPKEGLTGNVGTLVEVLRENGGVMGRYQLIDACVSRGMNLSTCMVLLLNSAPVVPVSPHAFALVGVQVWPSDVDRLTPSAPRPRVLQDFGRTSEGRLWVSVKASVSVVTHGLVNVPGSLESYLQGDFEVATAQIVSEAPDDPEVDAPAFKVRVSQQFVTGLRGPLRNAGADVGDTVLMVFDPDSRKVAISVGDESVRFAYEE